MIFGAASLYGAVDGGEWSSPLMLTAAVALFSAAASPFAAAMALRSAID
jgi:ABC-type transport system involved in cytochrome c biogenesis permease component